MTVAVKDFIGESGVAYMLRVWEKGGRRPRRTGTMFAFLSYPFSLHGTQKGGKLFVAYELIMQFSHNFCFENKARDSLIRIW